ncbi:MAG: SGNH/GDSL hydrolase family protein [Thermodesulfobacteriota bacterium]
MAVVVLGGGIWFNLFGVKLSLGLNPAGMYHMEGRAYGTNVPNPNPRLLYYRPDEDRHLDRSRAALFEGEKELGPAHVVHREIAAEGRGRFSHWNQTIVFSASDNTSPMDNGRGYRILIPAFPTRLFNLILLAAMLSAAAGVFLFQPVWLWFKDGWHRLMAVSLGRVLTLTAVNLIVLVIMLIVVEAACRLLFQEPPLHGQVAPGQYSKFAQYVMTTNDPRLDIDGVWFDPIHKVKIPYHIQTNNLGFRMKRDLDVTTKYEKSPREKVVLIFGGSAAFGFGNTSNETTIAGYLEKALNARQGEYKYTVFNMGNGGWVVFQEFIALVLYGLNLNPDWIITMDGRNDIWTIHLVQGEDVGSPFPASTFRNYMDGYLYRQRQPDFYRGRLENWLVAHSLAYRLLTGKKPVPSATPGPVARGRDWRDVDRTISFYLQVQENMLKVCPTCRYILSTQAMYIPQRRLMTDDELGATAEKHKDLAITADFMSSPKFNDMLMYAQTSLIKKTKALCDRYPERCRYQAIDHLFPVEDELKSKYFVDDVHFNDQGNALIADFYARTILETDLKIKN